MSCNHFSVPVNISPPQQKKYPKKPPKLLSRHGQPPPALPTSSFSHPSSDSRPQIFLGLAFVRRQLDEDVPRHHLTVGFFPHQKPSTSSAREEGLVVTGVGGLNWWNWGKNAIFGVVFSCWFVVGEGRACGIGAGGAFLPVLTWVTATPPPSFVVLPGRSHRVVARGRGGSESCRISKILINYLS